MADAPAIRRPTPALLAGLFGLCVLVAGLFWLRAVSLTEDGVPLDDAWIYFQFARMGAAGHFGEFNAGEVVTGITGPLWALFLTPLHALAGENLALFLVLVKILGILLLYSSMIAIYYLGAAVFHDERAGVGAAVLLPLMPKVVWGALSGMEAPLLVFLVILSLYLIIRYTSAGVSRDVVTPVVIGLAALTRPEAAFLFLVFAGYQLLLALVERRPAAPLIGRLALQTLLFALVLSPNILFTYNVTGQPLANTYYAKARGIDLALSLRFFALGSLILWVDPPATATIGQMLAWPPASADLVLRLLFSGLKAAVVAGFFLYALWRAPDRRKALPVLAWLAGDFLLYTVLFTRSNRHYFVPMLPAIALLAGAGLALAASEWRRRASGMPALALIAVLLVAGMLDWSNEYAWNVKNINDQQVAIGRWAAATLPADAVLAINDVGAIKYFSDRRIIDVTGLLTPELVEYTRAGRKMEYLRAAAPDYLIVYDSWFPEARAWAGFEPLREFRLEQNTIAGGDTVRVYTVRSFPPEELR